MVFKGLDNINEMLEHVSSFEGEPKKSKKGLLNIIYIYLLTKEVDLIVMLY